MADLARQTIGLGSKPGLIVVDMSNGFTNTDCPLACDCADVIAANKRLLDAFREAGLPVFFTTVVYHDQAQASVFRQRVPALNVLTPGSEWVAIHQDLAPQTNEVLIEKQGASAFYGTELADLLVRNAVDSLVVTGLTTSGCVRATVVDGLQNNYPVLVPPEAVGDRNSDAHHANLHDMHAKYADVLGLDEVLTLIEGGQ